MIKTNFMKLYEKLNNINEGIDDVDFKALAAAEKEAAELEKEIRDLERKYSNKVYTAVNADEQYKKFTTELNSLEKQLRKLIATYEKRELIQLDDGDFDYDYWTDKDAYELVKDRVDELSTAMQDLKAKLHEVEATVKKQFEADQLTINSKKAERDQHRSTATAITNQLEQSYSDVEAEVTKAAKAIGALVDEATWHGHIKSYIEPKLSVPETMPDRMLVPIVFTITGKYVDLEVDDFDKSSDEASEYAAAKIEEYAIEDGGCHPEAIASDMELTPAGEKGWYKIPDSDWELWKEYDVVLVDAPSISYDYDDYKIDGRFKVEVTIYLGKKVNLYEELGRLNER